MKEEKVKHNPSRMKRPTNNHEEESVLCLEAARKELLNELIRRSLIKIEASPLLGGEWAEPPGLKHCGAYLDPTDAFAWPFDRPEFPCETCRWAAIPAGPTASNGQPCLGML
jgi:hypothetical protein